MFKERTILFLCIMICLMGCRKDPITYHLTDFEKSFADFKNGSYWIFQDDSTFVEDSLYVNYLYTEIVAHEIDGKIDYQWERIHCIINSYPNTTHSSSFHVKASDGGECEFNGRYVGYNFENNSIVPYNSFTASINSSVNSYGTFTVNNVVYYSVYEIISPTVFSDSTASMINAFIAPNYGLIKWSVLYNDSSRKTWSLVRSNIVR